jgi:TadE-like protein
MAEFMLVAPVLFLLVFGIIDFGRGMSANVTVTNSAREGARYLATSVTLNEPNTWPTTPCSSTAVCTLNMSCPQGSSTAPAAPPDYNPPTNTIGSGQAKAWRQMVNDGFDMSSTNVVMTVKFFKKDNDPVAAGAAPDLVVTCSGFGVAPSYSTSTYLPQTGDWVVFDVVYRYHPSTPLISSIFPQITMEQSATMVLE